MARERKTLTVFCEECGKPIFIEMTPQTQKQTEVLCPACGSPTPLTNKPPLS